MQKLANVDAETLTDALNQYLDVGMELAKLMPQKGNASFECQRVGLINALGEVGSIINEIAEDDLVPDDNFGNNQKTDASDLLASLGHLQRKISLMAEH